MGRISTSRAWNSAAGLRRVRISGCAAAWPVLLVTLALAVVGACSTAKRRGEPGNLAGSLRQRDAETATFFSEVYRSGGVYVDFRPVMVADALCEDRRYRKLLVRTAGESLLLDPARSEALAAAQERRLTSHLDFLVFHHDGTNKPVRLHRADSPWKAVLCDDDGETLQPATVDPIKPDSPTHRFLQPYCDGLDRWGEPSRVSFPKLPKGRLGQPSGEKPVQLLVTSLSGTVILTWELPAVFYDIRPPQGEKGQGRNPPGATKYRGPTGKRLLKRPI